MAFVRKTDAMRQTVGRVEAARLDVLDGLTLDSVRRAARPETFCLTLRQKGSGAPRSNYAHGKQFVCIESWALQGTAFLSC
eukprot:SAG22_NODE_14789_length_365_cov_0.552632_1_plen_80_part_10